MDKIVKRSAQEALSLRSGTTTLTAPGKDSGDTDSSDEEEIVEKKDLPKNINLV